MMMLFFVGVVEMIIVTIWTKFVSETRILASGAVTMVNIFIWYYVLERILADIGNWQLVLLYAAGCALGTMLGGTLGMQMDRMRAPAAASLKEESAA